MAKQRNWGSAAAMLAFAGFVAISLWAKWNPALAQEKTAPAPGAEAQKAAARAAAKAAKGKGAPGKGAAAKQRAKGDAKAPEFTRAVPGAGKKLDAMALAKVIDQEINLNLKSAGVPASSLASDAEFYRRVHLDLTGVIPTPDKVLAFLDNKDANKRQKAIDDLLADERFGKSLSEVFSGLMIPRESNNRRLDHKPFQGWLAKSFNDNVPLDKLAYDLLTSTGNLDENGAVGYFVGNPTVDKMTDNVSRMFLGVRLECAQCHNHPFVSWKQDEYWGMAAFFMKTKLTVNPQQAAKKGVAPGIFESGGPAKGKKGNLPESAKIVPAKFLQADQPTLNKEDPYRPVLAKWVVSPQNPFFARAMVNRFWHQLFGRGIVNPVDDMHEDNAPSHPELLAALTEQFKANQFDLKYLIRAICNSEAYQRTSRPVDANKDDREFFSHRAVRVLSPEQLYDSIVTVLGQTQAKGDRAAQKQKGVPGGPREQFLSFFRVDEVDPQDYQAGIPQALRLMNSAQLNATQGIADNAMKAGGSDSNKIIEQLYLTVLSRPPTQAELSRLNDYVRKQETPRLAYSDISWVLLNSSEFTLNH
jgi:hypothetical protein